MMTRALPLGWLLGCFLVHWAIAGEEAKPEAAAKLPEGASRELPGHPGGIDGFATLTDQNWILSAGRDQSLQLCDYQTGRVVDRFEAVEFANRPDRRELRFAEQMDYRFCGIVASARKKDQFHRIVTAAGFGPKNVRFRVISVSAVAKGDSPMDAEIARVDFQPQVEGRLVIPDKNDEFITGVSTKQRIQEAERELATYRIYDLALSPDGRWLVASHSEQRVDLYDLDESPLTGKPVRSWKSGEFKGAVMNHRPLFLANGDLLIGGERRKAPKWEFQGKIDMLQEAKAEGPEAFAFRRVLFDPKEKWFFRVDRSDASTLEYFSAAAAKKRGEQKQLTGHTAAIRSIVASPDGRFVASSDADGTVIVRSLPALAEIQKLQLGHVDVPQIAFSANGKELITADSGGRLLIWNVASEKGGAGKAAIKKNS